MVYGKRLVAIKNWFSAYTRFSLAKSFMVCKPKI